MYFIDCEKIRNVAVKCSINNIFLVLIFLYIMGITIFKNEASHLSQFTIIVRYFYVIIPSSASIFFTCCLIKYVCNHGGRFLSNQHRIATTVTKKTTARAEETIAAIWCPVSALSFLAENKSYDLTIERRIEIWAGFRHRLEIIY